MQKLYLIYPTPLSEHRPFSWWWVWAAPVHMSLRL